MDRPRSVSVVAGTLVVLAVVCALLGLAATEISACCGTSEPPEGRHAVIGLLIGGAVAVAAAGLWAALLPGWALVLATSPVPIMCAVAAWSSSDLAGLLPFALVGWLAFWWFVRWSSVTMWLARRLES